MLSSPGEKNRIMPAVKTDGRTQGALRRREAVMHKPEMVITLLQRALNEGIKADYVLMDTWFTAGPLLLAIRKPDLHVAGMVRQLKPLLHRQNGPYPAPATEDGPGQNG